MLSGQFDCGQLELAKMWSKWSANSRSEYATLHKKLVSSPLEN